MAQPVPNRAGMPQQRPAQQYCPAAPNMAQPVQNRPGMPQQRPAQQYRQGAPNMAQPVQNRPAAAQNYQAPQQYRPPVQNGGGAVQQARPAVTNVELPEQAVPANAPAEQDKTPAADNAAMVGMLVCTKGGEMGENFALKAGRNSIGISSDCDIVIKDSTLTEEHDFEIVYDEQRKHFSLVPGKVSSKLFLNNEYVDSAVFMRAHDTIRSGQSEFLLVII